MHEQFWRFFVNAVQGDFGHLAAQQAPGGHRDRRALHADLLLTVAAMVWSVLLGMVIGIVSAVWRNRWPDRLGMTLAITGISFSVVCPGHAADADVLGAPGLAAHGGRRHMAPLHPAFDHAGGGRGGGDGALHALIVHRHPEGRLSCAPRAPRA
jgi:hypothetical protein